MTCPLAISASASLSVSPEFLWVSRSKTLWRLEPISDVTFEELCHPQVRNSLLPYIQSSQPENIYDTMKHLLLYPASSLASLFCPRKPKLFLLWSKTYISQKVVGQSCVVHTTVTSVGTSFWASYETLGWYYYQDKSLWLDTNVVPHVEPTTIILLNSHTIKLILIDINIPIH